MRVFSFIAASSAKDPKLLLLLLRHKQHSASTDLILLQFHHPRSDMAALRHSPRWILELFGVVALLIFHCEKTYIMVSVIKSVFERFTHSTVSALQSRRVANTDV